MPGIPISVIRQQNCDKSLISNDEPDENVDTAYPADSNRFSSDSRTLGSSSTTAMTGLWLTMTFLLYGANASPGFAVAPQCARDRPMKPQPFSASRSGGESVASPR